MCIERVCIERVCIDRVCIDRVCIDRVCIDKVCIDKVCIDRVCIDRVCGWDAVVYLLLRTPEGPVAPRHGSLHACRNAHTECVGSLRCQAVVVAAVVVDRRHCQ